MTDNNYMDVNSPSYSPVADGTPMGAINTVEADYSNDPYFTAPVSSQNASNDDVVNALRKALLPAPKTQRAVALDGGENLSDAELQDLWDSSARGVVNQNEENEDPNSTNYDPRLDHLLDRISGSPNGRDQNNDPYAASLIQHGVLPDFKSWSAEMKAAAEEGADAQDKFGYETLQKAITNLYRVVGKNTEGALSNIIKDVIPQIIEQRLAQQSTKTQTAAAFASWTQTLPQGLRGSHQAAIMRPIFQEAISHSKGDLRLALQLASSQVKRAFPNYFNNSTGNGANNQDYGRDNSQSSNTKEQAQFNGWLNSLNRNK